MSCRMGCLRLLVRPVLGLFPPARAAQDFEGDQMPSSYQIIRFKSYTLKYILFSMHVQGLFKPPKTLSFSLWPPKTSGPVQQLTITPQFDDSLGSESQALDKIMGTWCRRASSRV